MKKLITILSLTVLFSSCDNFLDKPNEDYSNLPLAENGKPSQKLAGAQFNVLTTEILNLNPYGNSQTYVYALSSGYVVSSEDKLNFSSDTRSIIWENLYRYTDNFQDIIDSEALYPQYSNHMAIAKIMKVQGIEKIVNLYGDAPYTDAFTDDLTPAYDDDLTIYKKLLSLLDDARNQINNAPSDVVTVGSEDIVFYGNMTKWEQYANTLELRLLLKFCNTTDASLIAYRTSRFANLNTGNLITQDVTFNPGFNTSADLQRNPMYRLYGKNLAFSADTSGYLSTCAGVFYASVLNGTLSTTNLVTTGVVDPRKARMFNTTGVIAGATQADPSVPTGRTLTSTFMRGFAGPTGATNDQKNTNACSRDAYVMLLAEAKFLKAEAIERGYITTGNAKTEYLAGIDASFDFYNKPFGNYTTTTLTPISSTAYKTAIATKQGLGYDGSTDKINAIITQKWIALAQWTGIEPYFDMVRTGYPNVPLPLGVSQTRRPVRLIYPTSEYSSNTANVKNVTLTDIFTINSTSPFWAK